MVNVYHVCVSYNAGGNREFYFDSLRSAERTYKAPLEWNGSVTLERISAKSPAALLSSPKITELKRRHQGL